jgi:hypothetical protein
VFGIGLSEPPPERCSGNSSKAEQFVTRNSDTKLGYETRRGFLVGLEFRNPPEFRIRRNSLFWKRETKLFFFSFVNETRIRNSNPETKLVLYRRKRGPDTKLRYESPNKNPHRSFVSEFRIRNPQNNELGQTQKRNSFVNNFVSSFVSGGVSYPVSCDELFSLTPSIKIVLEHFRSKILNQNFASEKF